MTLTLADIAQDPTRLGETPPEAIPALLGDLERLRAELWTLLVAPRRPDPVEGEQYLNADEAAKLLSIPKSYVYDLARQKRIPSVKVGKYRRFSRQALLRWAESGSLDKPLSTVHSPSNGQGGDQAPPKAARAHPGSARQTARRPSHDRQPVGTRGSKGNGAYE